MNTTAPYNTNLDDLPREGIRDGFGLGLLEAGKLNPNVVALSADLTASCKMDGFKKEFPHRFVEIGVAEQNLVGVAAGLAHIGKVPFCASFAAFSPGRNFDQIRVSVCYSDHNVKIYGGHAGLTVGEDGATHQICEDIAMMRTLPNIVVVVPCDKWQAYNATLALAKTKGPAYIRGSRAKTKSITNKQTPFTLGQIDIINDGTDITIVACGIMVEKAILAAKKLSDRGVSAAVLNAHTIKPFDEETLVAYAKKTKNLVVAEEHQKAGGLYSVVCEIISEHCPQKVSSVAVQDTFGESGTANELLEKYGLTCNKIIEECLILLENQSY